MGITESMISRMLHTGRLHRRHWGVYAVGHTAPVDLGDETEALLTCPHGAVLSHRSAATIWSLLKPIADDPVDVMVCGSQGGKGRARIRVHRTRLLPPRDVRIKDGLPVTSVARTLLDLADVATERELERALDEALIQRLVRLDDIREALTRATGRSGAPVLRGVLARRTTSTITRSEAEERFLALVRAAGLPEPEVNVKIHGYEVDFLWRAQGVVVEIDGFKYHRTKRAFERDHRKDGRLKAAGLDISRITWAQMDDEPLAVIARLAAALARRTPQSLA